MNVSLMVGRVQSFYGSEFGTQDFLGAAILNSTADEYDGQKFFTRGNAILMAAPPIVVMGVVEVARKKEEPVTSNEQDLTYA